MTAAADVFELVQPGPAEDGPEWYRELLLEFTDNPPQDGTP